MSNNLPGSQRCLKTLIIIPTYNESENIKELLTEILQLNLPNATLLVVDDNSPDGTANLVRNYAEVNPPVKLIVRHNKKGLGPSYITGFQYALAEQFDRVLMMDADGSHNPAVIPELLRELNDFDLVIGSRYLNGVSVVNWSLLRLTISIFANVYTRLITGLPIRDCTSGFKCLKRDILEKIPLDQINSTGYAFQIELHYRAWKSGLNLKEIPIIFIEREKGQSKMSKQIIIEAMFKVWHLRLSGLLGKY